MKHQYKYLCLLLLMIAAISSCKKKLDHEFDNRPNQQPMALSSTRLVSLGGGNELEINGVPLTSFVPPDKEGSYNPEQMKGTMYFPETGKMAAVFTIPLQFVDATGTINKVRLSSLSPGSILPPSSFYTMKDTYNDPHDYYYTRFVPNTGTKEDSMFYIPRSISQPSAPDKFKIRLLNLASNDDHHHIGNMSLTMSDGTPVTTLQNIAPGTYSDYIEMAYGAYQFKVLDSDGKEVPAKSSAPFVYLLNPQTGTLMNPGGAGTPGAGGFSDTWLTYSPLKTYQPGGVYTIVISSASGYSSPIPGSNGETVGVIGNTFQVIADVSEPVNNTYARVQSVNTLQSPVKWQIDNNTPGNAMGFTEKSSYASYITGNHIVKLTDASGALLAEEKLQLMGGDNITAWSYLNKEGKPAIRFSANNLSTKFTPGTNGNDGSYNSNTDVYPFWIRFMNFCNGQGEVTFTSDNGQPFTGGDAIAANHIGYSQPINSNPYVRFAVNSSAKILAYASSPAVLPGTWLSEVTSLKSTDFIANKNLYKTPLLPNSEPGIYTVVLVGSVKAGAGAAEKPKMIIVKHNR